MTSTYKIQDLNELNYKEIAEICRSHYIKVAGKKAGLIDKIIKKTSNGQVPIVKKIVKKTVTQDINKPTKKLSAKIAIVKKPASTVVSKKPAAKKPSSVVAPKKLAAKKPAAVAVSKKLAAKKPAAVAVSKKPAAIVTPSVTEVLPVTESSTTALTTSTIAESNSTEIANTTPPPKDLDPDNEVISIRMTRENCNGGELHASLIWNDIVDLDLHVITPGGEHLYFGNKESRCGGWLDRDMNAGQLSEEPIENIFWASAGSGKYEIYVHYFNPHCISDPRFTDPNRSVPFRVRLIRSGVTNWFEGTIAPYKKVTCFTFTLKGNGAVGSFVVVPPNDVPATFQQLCAKNNITYSQGEGFYALKKKENISVQKDMVLHNTKSDTFTIGHLDVCTLLGVPIDKPLVLTPKDIPADHRLFVQSTSHNRNIPADTHVLMRVSVKEALRFRQGDKYNFK